ncbi:Protein dopey [Podosphaera aphanis]|nr:Protein dopey [Podosphaera aphanis]
MALEPGVSSEPNSGKNSPVIKKWRSPQDEPTVKDKAFRRYAASVDRSLMLFETALQEWADYISSLSKLLKSLQARPPNRIEIPSKAIVAKRLAQCLNPSLPSGVHQKALEVYGFIFSIIGKDALSEDLPLYLPGLSPTLSFASLSVRTRFLELVETYLLVIHAYSLRPALKAVILSLLPGLEDETSEEFERTLQLLDGFKKAIRPQSSENLGDGHSSGDEFFWQCFFLASITSNNRRVGALAYLTRNLPKLGHSLNLDSQSASTSRSKSKEKAVRFARLSEIVTSPEPGLLLRCFAAGLADEQLLTQRGFLDLLVTHLPLHSDVLQNRVKVEDLELLIAAAAGVVSRREMSLNRRLWNWLLGPEQSSADHDSDSESSNSTSEDQVLPHASRTYYFEKFGLYPLTQALLKLINRDPVSSIERARPFKICLSLMDRWEIGGQLVPDIFLPAIDSVRRYKDLATTKAEFSEVLRSAIVFFDGVESGLIWGEIVELVSQAIDPGRLSIPQRLDKISLVNFIITHFNVRDEEMLLIHAPLITLTILIMIESQLLGDLKMNEEISDMALKLAIDLVELIPERTFQSRDLGNHSSTKLHERISVKDPVDFNFLQKIKAFYTHEQGNPEACPYSSQEVTELLLEKAGTIMCHALSKLIPPYEAGTRTQLLISLLSKVPHVKSLDISKLSSAMASRLSDAAYLPFLVFTSINSLATSLYLAAYISTEELSELVVPLVKRAWYFLSASYPKYHVETVRCLWQLQATLTISNHEIEAAICTLMTENDLNGAIASRNADPGRSFSVLWTHTLQDNLAHRDRRSSKVSRLENQIDPRFSCADNFEVMLSRPLFLLLDALLDERTQLFMTVKIWLQNLTGIEKLFHIFVIKFSQFDFLQRLPRDPKDSLKEDTLIYRGEYDLDQCLYYLRTLSNVLRWSSESAWAALAMNNISIEIEKKLQIDDTGNKLTILEFFMQVCLRSICGICDAEYPNLEPRVSQFHRTSLNVLHQILLCPFALTLPDISLEKILIGRLMKSMEESDPYLQVLLLDVVFAALKLYSVARPAVRSASPALESKLPMITTQSTPSNTQLLISTDSFESFITVLTPPANLVKCLQTGLIASSSRPVLDSWISFLTECLPLYSENIFQILIPLVGTLCSQIGSTFSSLQKTFREAHIDYKEIHTPESTLISLLNGLERVVERGHDRLVQDELKTPRIKSPDQPQGFFGNMVSGVFATENPQSRSVNANNRLTVLLIFQDAVKVCFMIWSWGGDDLSTQDLESISSFNYTSLRMRNRARRLLEHMFAAEALECLETMVEMWRKFSNSSNNIQSLAVFNLLHVLDGSRPKHTIPAVFNAIYSRTNPSALESSQKSTLTSSLSDTDLIVFLVEYAQTLEDDTMGEIWEDCMAFLKDILANPFPHRQILPSLMEFAAILGEKVDNTNFGEQRKMRRELGDLFLRLLTAVFTTRPIGFLESTTEADERSKTSVSRVSKADDIVGILADIVPNLPKILIETDRVLNAANIICSSAIGPTFKSKSFPENVSKNTLVLLYKIARLPQNQKLWKKDLADAFNDPRFFDSPIALVNSNWLSLLKQWSLNDKDRMPELISRLVSPTTAGIVFGVGATSIRNEADRKTQLNLRRIATLVLSTMHDNFIKDLPLLQEKIVELLSATALSSPSSITRAEIYILLRALALQTSAIHLATLWPVVNAELHSALTSFLTPDDSAVSETYNNRSILEACKLLDTLIYLAPDDFQIHEWLFITDTIDAVYRPPDFEPIALTDRLSEKLGSTIELGSIALDSVAVHAVTGQTRKPLLGKSGIDDAGPWEKREEFVAKFLRPFFSQLSIFAFESTYSMCAPDVEACRTRLLEDLFDGSSIVKAS